MRRDIRNRQVKLPRVHRVSSGGRVICYHRVTRARLPDLPETHPDFVAAWAVEDAKAAPQRQPDGALAKAITDMRRGARWRALSDGYRAMMLRELDAIRAAYGNASPKGLRARHINADLAPLDPVAANKRLRAWRLIGAHLVRMGETDTDPSAGIRKQPEPTDGHQPWTADEVARFRARWPVGGATRGCFDLLWWTGLRVSDAVAVSWSQIDAGGVLHLRQTKTGGAAWIPWTAPLPARAAGIDGRSAHGLRKTRLTLIAEAGGSAHAIMSWGGHKSLSEAQRYTESANLRGLVTGAEQEQNVVKRL